MMIDSVGIRPLEIAPRNEGRSPRGRGEGRFSVDQKESSEGPSRPEEALSRSDRAGAGRRRTPIRYSKRVGEAHGAKEQGHDDDNKIAETEFHLDFGQGDADGDDDGDGSGEPQHEGNAEDDRATSADFEAIATHLLQLQGPIREVTLYLPSLGRVTARMEAGAISITVDVPRRLVAAVRRGEKEMLNRMNQQGLNVSRIRVESHDDDDSESESVEAPPLRTRPARGLVDVMA